MLRHIFALLVSARYALGQSGRMLAALVALSALAACAQPPPVADTYEEPEEVGTVASALVTLDTLSVSPPSAALPAGLTQLFKASGLYSDGKTRTLASGITWSSSNVAVATIASDGTALTVAAGVVTITALHPATGKSATATLTVTTETIVSIAITPTSKSVGLGATVSYVATAKFSAGTSVALKGSIVAWSSSRATIDATGKVVTKAGDEGLSAIGARHVPSGVQSPSAELFVSSSPLTSITIAPLAPRMPKGTSQSFTATGVLANGMTSDLTGAAVWSSSNSAVASISTAGASPIVTAVGVGSAAIRAKFGTLTGSSTVTVPAAVLTSLAISPPNPRVSLGTTHQLVATGTYNDLTTLDRTEAVTWSSSATAVLKVSTAAGSRGKLTPIKVGTATITAKDATTLITTTTLVTVTNVTLVGLSVSPATATAPLGTSVAFHATGSYSDASTKDLTSTVTWSSANTNAIVSNADPTRGVATASGVGATSITAQLGAITAAATLNVSAPALVRLEMTAPTVSLVRDLSQQLEVNGIYSDGSVVSFDAAVGWTSSNPAVASVANDPGNQGIVKALAVGSATVTATDPVSGFSATTAISVTAPTLLSINLLAPDTLQSVRVPRGFSATPEALGIYSNGRAIVINELCTWSSSDPGVLAVSNVAGERGELTGLEIGTSTITVTEPVSGVTASVAYQTIAARVVDFTIVPGAAVQLAVGQTLGFTTRANYTDGTVGNPQVRWQLNGNAALASIDGSFGSTVNLTALAPGQVELYAAVGPNVTAQVVAVTIVDAEQLQLAAGGLHVCALIPNVGVKCWGNNGYGQLGLGDTASRSAPAALAPVSLGADAVPVQLSVGLYHSCVLLRGGAVKCWGRNDYGELGQGDTRSRGNEPNTMGDSLPSIDVGGPARAVIAGGIHTCALLVNGSVKCWGLNRRGALGLGDTNDMGDEPNEMGVNLPAIDLGTGRTAKEIFAGADTTCAVLDDDTTKCWGLNDQGGGMGFAPVLSASQSVFGDVPGEMGDALPVVTVSGFGAPRFAMFAESGCARLPDGTAKCFGYNAEGALGLGDRQNWRITDNKPAIDFGAGRTVSSIATGFYQACAILDTGGVKCFGQGAYGIGYGDTSNRGDAPGEMGDALPFVDLGTGRTAKRLVVGSAFVCAVLDNDRVKCWGYNGEGQLGLGDTEHRGDQPGEMGDALPYVELVSAGACVAPPNGLISSWRADNDASDSEHARDGSGVPNASFTPGKVGASFLFSGGTYVTASSAGLPLGASDRTLEAWVRLDALTANFGEAFFAGYGGFGNGGASFAIGASGSQVFFSQWGDGLAGPNLSLGTWTHVAAVSAGSVVSLYVDGAKVDERAMFVNTQPGAFVIGAIPGDAYRQLDGAVDEVTLYDRALSAAEVSSIYTAGAAGKCH